MTKNVQPSLTFPDITSINTSSNMCDHTLMSPQR